VFEEMKEVIQQCKTATISLEMMAVSVN